MLILIRTITTKCSLINGTWQRELLPTPHYLSSLARSRANYDKAAAALACVFLQADRQARAAALKGHGHRHWSGSAGTSLPCTQPTVKWWAAHYTGFLGGGNEWDKLNFRAFDMQFHSTKLSSTPCTVTVTQRNAHLPLPRPARRRLLRPPEGMRQPLPRALEMGRTAFPIYFQWIAYMYPSDYVYFI